MCLLRCYVDDLSSVPTDHDNFGFTFYILLYGPEKRTTNQYRKLGYECATGVSGSLRN